MKRLVLYTHPVRLQETLRKAGVVPKLITIPGGGRGNFPPDPWQLAYAGIERFLAASCCSRPRARERRMGDHGVACGAAERAAPGLTRPACFASPCFSVQTMASSS